MITLRMKITIEVDGDEAAALLAAHVDDGYLDDALLDLLRLHLEVERVTGEIFKATAEMEADAPSRQTAVGRLWKRKA